MCFTATGLFLGTIWLDTHAMLQTGDKTLPNMNGHDEHTQSERFGGRIAAKPTHWNCKLKSIHGLFNSPSIRMPIRHSHYYFAIHSPPHVQKLMDLSCSLLLSHRYVCVCICCWLLSYNFFLCALSSHYECCCCCCCFCLMRCGSLLLDCFDNNTMDVDEKFRITKNHHRQK